MVQFKGAGASNAVLADGVVGPAYSLGVEGPVVVHRGREESHAPVPVSPPLLEFRIALGIVAERGGGCCFCYFRNFAENFSHELRCCVAVDDARVAASEPDFVHERRYQREGCAVGEGDDKNRFGKCIYDSKGFAFAVIGKALSLEVHVVAGSGTGEWAVGVHAMGNASFSLFVFAYLAVL